MMSGIKRWMTLKMGAFLGALTIAAVGGAIAAKLTDIGRWEIWDILIEKEPSDTPVVLSPNLQHDVKGTLSARLRIALEKMGVAYRTIDREFPVLPTIVPSGEVPALVIEQGERLLEQHGGDIIVYGSAGTKDGHVFLRLFAQSDCGCLHGATPFDLTSEDWEATLTLMIESVITMALGAEYLGDDWIGSGMPLSHSMRVWEKKFGKLADLVEDDTWKKEASGLAEHAKLTRMKVEGDGSGIQELWREATERLSAELAQCKDDRNQCHIRRELLFLADLAIYDGLMNSLPERIEEGLSLALLAGKETMDREALDDPYVLRPPMQATFRDWLLMANLILACDAQTAMHRFTDQLDTYLSSDKERHGFRGGDVERMLWPIAVLRHGDIPKDELEEYFEFLSQHPYFGWPQPDYWQDPFLHAKRSIRRRLQRMELEHLRHLDSRFLGQPQCPSLPEWMQTKGWGNNLGTNRVPNWETDSDTDR